MMRLIDADELIETKGYWHGERPDWGHPFAEGVDAVDTVDIEDAPTIDAVPVVHGMIIQTIKNGKMNRVFSCCNTDFTQLTMWITPNYCPNCGAKMDGDGNE